MSGSWSSQAIDRACSNPAWSTLLDDIYSHLQKEITHLNYSKVTELSEAEVAVLVQKRFEEVNQLFPVFQYMTNKLSNRFF